MLKEFAELAKRFQKIEKAGWIQAANFNSGLFLEKLLGLGVNDFFIPDFGNVEIKTHKKGSCSRINLFTVVPDSGFCESKRLASLYGYPDKDFKNINILAASFNAKSNNIIACKYFFRLVVNRKAKKIYIVIYDLFFRILDDKTFWTFELLEERINIKLKFLAICCNESIFFRGKKYFRYSNFEFFQIKNFNTFINLVESGVIWGNIRVSVFKGNYRYKQLHDHGCGFTIDFKDITKLYDRVDF